MRPISAIHNPKLDDEHSRPPPSIFSGRRNAPIILIFASFEPIVLFKTVLYGCLLKSNSWSRDQLSVKRKTVHFEKKKNDSCPVMRKERFYENLRGFRVPLTIGIQNPSFSKRLESSAWNPKSTIQDCLGFPYTGRICTKNDSTLTGW